MLYVARAAISTINGWHKSLNMFFHFAMKMCQLGRGRKRGLSLHCKKYKITKVCFYILQQLIINFCLTFPVPGGPAKRIARPAIFLDLISSTTTPQAFIKYEINPIHHIYKSQVSIQQVVPERVYCTKPNK